MDVSINLPQITWTNGAGATSIEVFFNGSLVYSGAPTTSYTILGPLIIRHLIVGELMEVMVLAQLSEQPGHLQHAGSKPYY